MAKGQTIKEELFMATRITASIIIKTGSFRPSKDIFEVHKETVKEKKDAMIEKLRNEEIKYRKHVEAAERELSKKDKLENMTIKELTDICRPLKQKEDGAMPKKKTELIDKYRKWHGRPVPTFDVLDDDIMSVLDSNNNKDDICTDNVEIEIYEINTTAV